MTRGYITAAGGGHGCGAAAHPAADSATGPRRLRGHVIDSLTKEPVAGCTLRVGGSGHFNTLVSGPDGAYELKDIAADSYFFIVQCPAHLMDCACRRHARQRTKLLGAPAGRSGRAISSAMTSTSQMVPGAIARGQVVAFDGRPGIARATVRLGRGMRGEANRQQHAGDDRQGRTF